MNKSTLKYLLFSAVITCFANTAKGQQAPNMSNISGNFEINSQYYIKDSLIDAPEVPEKVLSNGFMNLNFDYGNFKAGIRYESYLNVLQGFDPNYKGSGITYRYASFTNDGITITAGNFYDQFGSGLIFRSYEERALGVDNAMDGLHVRYTPIKGMTLKGFIAEQRNYFSKGPGIVRGFDGDLQLNDLLPGWEAKKLRIGLGGSFVSKYQKDDSPSRILPENVGAYAGRTTIAYGSVSFDAEYAYKINDPSIVNKFIYKNGEALLMNLSYAKKGMGAKVSAKRIDNMNYRSDRGATGNSLSINYLPAINKQLTYRLSTLYPFATQPNGEMGISGEFYYNFKSGTPLGGKYGTMISLSGSAISDIQRGPVSNDTLGYTSDFFSIGENRYYQDATVEINKKLSKKDKLILTYIYQVYDKDVIEGKIGEPQVTAHIGVIDYTHKFNSKHSVRTELQHLMTDEDKKNWAMALVEYSYAPHWTIAVFDEWNYGNKDEHHRFHYYNASLAYNKGATRISLAYARQRAGLLCVGGVCRFVPASNGFNVTITSRF
ncbi:MAG TPA: DUF6029 family protein [Bacteroidia bacterium]|jgi:hypothetical protein|nr:DUF6029 family protein [Bacteroidia bacterium]HQF27176.1 DUF6029 family protein [Bacteroidia bacterium]HQK96960.1 DUF6029 family protein [Bacteroidia bacterium]